MKARALTPNAGAGDGSWLRGDGAADLTRGDGPVRLLADRAGFRLPR